MDKLFEKTFFELLKNLPKEEIIAPSNTIAHIFNHDHKENFISDWLAFLLSPDLFGNSEVLNALLRLVNFDNTDEPVLSVSREYTFEKSGRRIDFLIETSETIIGIENKIWSSLGQNQLKDYREEISDFSNSLGKRHLLILLHPSGNSSVSDAKGKDKLYKFNSVTYESLIEEFKTIRVDFINNLRSAFLLQDFITHLEEYILMTNPTEDIIDFEMLSFTYNNEERIKKLNEKIYASKKQFTKYIERTFYDCFSEEDWLTFSSGSASFFQLYKSNWDRLLVHFELMSYDDNGKHAVFPPHTMKVVLHTHEGGTKGKTPYLYNLGKTEVAKYIQEKYGKDYFEVSYDSPKEFEKSIKSIMSVMKDVVNKYSSVVDRELTDEGKESDYQE